ncbi:MAG: transglycosylase SLT domain-containing protein [Candidatus Margulisbacteria bacterium]|nr:transglycosylase SLT domain-containing protein [Candidatus Margulisiibacteriota bacterium]
MTGLLNLVLLVPSVAVAQTKAEWYQQKLAQIEQLFSQGSYHAGIRQAGLLVDQLCNGGDGSMPDLQLLRNLKTKVKQGETLAIAMAKSYAPLPPPYLNFAIDSLPQPIKDSNDIDLQAKYICFTMAMIHAESRFNAQALNQQDGATGLGQVKLATAEEVLGVDNPNLLNPATNIRAVEAHIYRLFVKEFNEHYPSRLMDFSDDSVTTAVIETYGGAEPNKVLNLMGLYKLLYFDWIKQRLSSQPFNQ